MIDTDKYEGHTPAPWITKVNQQVYDKDNNPIATVEYFSQENHSYYNKVLIADAPLLLEEVKRLYGEPRVTVDDYHKKGDLYVTVRFPDGEEYSGLVEKQEGEEE